MNRTDAAAILNVDPSASPDEARRAYQELFTEHQVRLTNAPTPALRSLYQSRLKELEEAKDALLASSPDDSTFDLPTDQPSIPSPSSYSSSRQSPPPPPPPRHTQPPPRPTESRVETKAQPAPATIAEAAPKKKSFGKGKLFFALFVVAVFVGGVLLLPDMLGNSDSSGSDTTAAVPVSTDSIPSLRENVTIARVEFGRGDYDAANSALADADRHYADLSSAAKSDTAVTRLKDQLDQLHTKVTRACEALKRVAERHPGEKTCKPI